MNMSLLLSIFQVFSIVTTKTDSSYDGVHFHLDFADNINHKAGFETKVKGKHILSGVSSLKICLINDLLNNRHAVNFYKGMG